MLDALIDWGGFQEEEEEAEEVDDEETAGEIASTTCVGPLDGG